MFNQEVLNGFRNTHRPAAAEIPATRPDCRAFVGIYPPVPKLRPDQWLIRKFEIPAKLIDTEVKDEDLLDAEFVSLDTLLLVERWLRIHKLQDAVFLPTMKSDYPL